MDEGRRGDREHGTIAAPRADRRRAARRPAGRRRRRRGPLLRPARRRGEPGLEGAPRRRRRARATAWLSGLRTAGAGSSRPSPCTRPARRSSPSTPVSRARRPPTSSPRAARACSSRRPTSWDATRSRCSTPRPSPSPPSRRVVVLAGPTPARAVSWDAFLARADAVPADVADARALAVAPDDVCDIMFTSGTTGRPKGAMSTHAQTLRAFRDWADIVGLRAGDRYLVALPFFHSFGYKAGWLASLMMGATTLPARGLRRRRRPRARRARRHHRPARPAVALPVHPRARRPRDAAPRLAAPRGDRRRRHPGGARRAHAARDRVRAPCSPGYGLTEASGVATLCRDGDDPETIADHLGARHPGRRRARGRRRGARGAARDGGGGRPLAGTR